MHVLVLPSNYPNPFNPDKTPFYRDHARLLGLRGHAVGVAALVPVSLPTLVRVRGRGLGRHRGTAAGVTEWVRPYAAPPRSPGLDRRVRRRLVARLLADYERAHGRPDVIHAHGTPGGECARWWHRRTGVPYVVTLHSTALYGAAAPAEARRLAPVLAEAAARVAVSPGFAEHLADLTGQDFRYVPNPVDTGFFRPAARPAGAPFVFAHVADLNARKDQALLLRAFAGRFGGDPGYRLAIGGSGPQRTALAQLAGELGIAEQVTFAGQLDRAGVRDLLQGSDAFVLPSRQETFGVVLAEAMACGLPVVATRSDGPAAVIQGPTTGLLTEHEPGALGSAMARVALRPSDAAAIRAEAVARFGLAAVGRAVERLYAGILRGPDDG